MCISWATPGRAKPNFKDFFGMAIAHLEIVRDGDPFRDIEVV
jgi:hypothetical protein